MKRRLFTLLSIVITGLAAPDIAALDAPAVAKVTPRETNRLSIIVPLYDRAQWKLVRYSTIPPHTVDFSASGMDIEVRGSAMPIIHPLQRPTRVARVRAKGRIVGALRMPHGKQGSRGFDDYSLRVGIAEPAGPPLTPRQRAAAPSWILALCDTAPKGRGIAAVHFVNLAVESASIGQAHRHPKSDLIEEIVGGVPAKDGTFELVHDFSPPVEACAVWISVDGDDTGSHFRTQVQQLELEQAP